MLLVVEEILECGDCKSRVNQPVEDDQLGVLADRGMIFKYCSRCQRTTLWKYPQSSRYRSFVKSDPLLETFEHDNRCTSEPEVVPDPLLIGYDQMDQIVNNSKVSWDWFG